ncbi:hypothetical protein MIR68_012258 [Amoeboaphelidium protococcarum]|nr:hypothetical protein MIR68_012258 [Amoeboaphelidium protococcarum]
MFNKVKNGVSTFGRSSSPANGGSSNASNNSKIPSYFMCPISGEIMDDPTISQCGHMFERQAIVRWLREVSNSGQCPLCPSIISESTLAPCLPLKAAIAEFKASNGSGQFNSKSEPLYGVSSTGSPKAINPHHDQQQQLQQQQKSRQDRGISTISKKLKDVKQFVGSVSGGSKSSGSVDVKDVFNAPPATQQRKQKSGSPGDVGSYGGSRQKHGEDGMKSPKGGKSMNIGFLKGSSNHRASHGNGKMQSGKMWAKLTPILDNYPEVEINKEEFVIGRSSNCDRTFNASEISNIHCCIYRVKTDDGVSYDYFVEDNSTNGTYVNGSKIGKGLIANVIDGDELSLGERFTSQTIPKIGPFVDWVFQDTELTMERKMEAERIKSIGSFLDLIAMDNVALRDMGIRSEMVRSKVVNAVKNWSEKYRFPAFRLDILNSNNQSYQPGNLRSLPSTMPSSPMQDGYAPPMYQLSAAGGVNGYNNMNGAVVNNINNGNVGEISEVNFEPGTYGEKSSAGVVCMYLRRTRGVRGVISVKVTSTERGSAQMGSQFTPFEKVVTFNEGVNEMVLEFYWKSDVNIQGVATIIFEMKVVSGKAFVGHCAEAVLVIEAPVKAPSTNRAIKRASQGKKAASKPDQQMPLQQQQQQYLQQPQQQQPTVQQDKSAKKDAPLSLSVVEDRLMALMIEAFPTLETKDIAKVVKEEITNMAPVRDVGLLQDLIVIKLTRQVNEGDQLNLEYSNIRLTHTSQEKEEADGLDNQLEQEAYGMVEPQFSPPTFGLGMSGDASQPKFVELSSQFKAMQVAQPASNPVAVALQQSQVPNAAPNSDQHMLNMHPLMQQSIQQSNNSLSSGAMKLKTSIFRHELDSFLMMASLSLVRKFYVSQGIDSGVTHFKSPIVGVALQLAESFQQSVTDLQPKDMGQQPSDDIFDFDKVVELFKKFVYANGSDLRAKTSPLPSALLAKAFRYDISFQKSKNHVKMENNHAIIEDVNTFCKLNGPQVSFYGVFDGHGGYAISEYLSLHLAINICTHAQFQSDIKTAIIDGFKSTDDDVLKKIKRDSLRGGSTAVVAFLRERTLHVAWAGDARCLIFKKIGDNLVAFPISREHHPVGDEKDRIISMGGFVDHVAGKNRVNGRLAVSRSFGDANLKPVVSAVPDYSRFPLQGDEAYMLLSCDGLYDSMSYGDVAEYLEQCTKKKMPLSDTVSSLVQEGIARGTNDDVTVMIVDLQSTQ